MTTSPKLPSMLSRIHLTTASSFSTDLRPAIQDLLCSLLINALMLPRSFTLADWRLELAHSLSRRQKLRGKLWSACSIMPVGEL